MTQASYRIVDDLVKRLEEINLGGHDPEKSNRFLTKLQYDFRK